MVDRYVDDVISIVKITQVNILFIPFMAVDPDIKFTIESIGNHGSIPFLDTKYLPNEDHSIQTPVYR